MGEIPRYGAIDSIDLCGRPVVLVVDTKDFRIKKQWHPASGWLDWTMRLAREVAENLNNGTEAAVEQANGQPTTHQPRFQINDKGKDCVHVIDTHCSPPTGNAYDGRGALTWWLSAIDECVNRRHRSEARDAADALNAGKLRIPRQKLTGKERYQVVTHGWQVAVVDAEAACGKFAAVKWGRIANSEADFFACKGLATQEARRLNAECQPRYVVKEQGCKVSVTDTRGNEVIWNANTGTPKQRAERMAKAHAFAAELNAECQQPPEATILALFVGGYRDGQLHRVPEKVNRMACKEDLIDDAGSVYDSENHIYSRLDCHGQTLMLADGIKPSDAVSMLCGAYAKESE